MVWAGALVSIWVPVVKAAIFSISVSENAVAATGSSSGDAATNGSAAGERLEGYGCTVSGYSGCCGLGGLIQRLVLLGLVEQDGANLWRFLGFSKAVADFMNAAAAKNSSRLIA